MARVGDATATLEADVARPDEESESCAKSSTKSKEDELIFQSMHEG